MQPAIEGAISMMRDRYFEALTLNEVAAQVYVSPFHFSRIFAKATGVTPGRYLTAVRMFEAKRLLLTTSLTVSDIVCSVGYSSVGTFTSRFTRAVGMTPTQFREPDVNELLVAISQDFHRLPTLDTLIRAGKRCIQAPRVGGGTILGTLDLQADAAPANLLIGVFNDRIPQCAPVAYKALPNVGSTRLEIQNVPEGRWTVIAAAERAETTRPSAELYVGTARGPVAIPPGGTAHIHLRMRNLLATDPPIAITLASRITPKSARHELTGDGELSAAA